MVSFRSTRVLPATLVALMLISTTQAQKSIDFQFYPKTAQECMYKAADTSKCETGVVASTNSCLCRNGGNFVTNTAACLGRESRGDLQTVYESMEDACRNSNTPLNLSRDEFMAAANPATSTSSTSTPSTSTSYTSTATSSSTSSTSTETATTTSVPVGNKPAKEEKAGLSTGVLAGIIAGAVVGTVVLAGVVFFICRRNRKFGEESHPMLPDAYTQPIPEPYMQQNPQPYPQPNPHMSLAPSPADTAPSPYVSPPSTGGWPPPKDQPRWMPSPNLSDHRVSGFNWESPEHLALHPPDVPGQPQQYAAYQPYVPPPLPVELDAPVIQPVAGEPVEMAGTPVQPKDPRISGQQYHPSAGWNQVQI